MKIKKISFGWTLVGFTMFWVVINSCGENKSGDRKAFDPSSVTAEDIENLSSQLQGEGNYSSVDEGLISIYPGFAATDGGIISVIGSDADKVSKAVIYDAATSGESTSEVVDIASEKISVPALSEGKYFVKLLSDAGEELLTSSIQVLKKVVCKEGTTCSITDKTFADRNAVLLQGKIQFKGDLKKDDFVAFYLVDSKSELIIANGSKIQSDVVVIYSEGNFTLESGAAINTYTEGAGTGLALAGGLALSPGYHGASGITEVPLSSAKDLAPSADKKVEIEACDEILVKVISRSVSMLKDFVASCDEGSRGVLSLDVKGKVDISGEIKHQPDDTALASCTGGGLFANLSGSLKVSESTPQPKAEFKGGNVIVCTDLDSDATDFKPESISGDTAASILIEDFSR